MKEIIVVLFSTILCLSRAGLTGMYIYATFLSLGEFVDETTLPHNIKKIIAAVLINLLQNYVCKLLIVVSGLVTSKIVWC